jgi:multiple sugar transport system substrate-binding protein
MEEEQLNTKIDRRRLLGYGLAAGALSISGLPFSSAFAADAQMRCNWWGSAERNKRTLAVIDLYMKANPGVSIVGEPIAGSDYWTKLATSMAGRNVADIIQLEPGTISDYSGRGACLELDNFVGNAIDISGFEPKMVDLCRIGGKLYGVALGLNSFSMFYDTEAFKTAGIEAPKAQMTWDQFAEAARALTEAGGGKANYAGAPYGGRYHYVFEVWLRQRGKQIFSDNGSIGYNVDDAKEWFTYWENLRNKGYTVSADVQAMDDNTIESNALSLGNSSIGFAYSNQMVGYQQIAKNKLGIAMVPGNGSSKSGHYYRPGLIWCLGSTTKNAEEAAKFVSFFVNDIEAGKILGVERGVPMSAKVREAILPGLDETARATVDYVELLADKVDVYPAPAPIGANEFDRNVIRPCADGLTFGQLTIAEAAQKLVDDGTAVLSKRL